MLYDLSTQFDCDRLRERVEKAIKGRKRVDFTLKAETRTLSQNSYLHLLLGYYGLIHGHTIEEVKEHYFKELCNRDIFISYSELEFIGRVKSIKSTKDIDKETMIIAIDRFIKWCEEVAETSMPRSDDFLFINEAELRVSQASKFLY